MKIHQVKARNFALVVKEIKTHFDEADAFALDLDNMKVKGDLAVLQRYFEKPLIGRTADLDMARRAVKSNLAYVDVPVEFHQDLELQNLMNNKESEWLPKI